MFTHTDSTYNGWRNRATWNVALWLQNDEEADNLIVGENRAMVEAGNGWTADGAQEIARYVFGDDTPDGVAFDSPEIDWAEIVAMLNEGMEYHRAQKARWSALRGSYRG